MVFTDSVNIVEGVASCLKPAGERMVDVVSSERFLLGARSLRMPPTQAVICMSSVASMESPFKDSIKRDKLLL